MLQATATSSYKVLYNFKGGETDGANPGSNLINVNGTLYGTATNGGSAGKGVVYSVTTDGVEKILHNFQGASGAKPMAGLIEVGNRFYGTTYGGGHTSCGCGTVYFITASGAYGVLHSFAGGSDGAYPEAALVDLDGTLYGTTNEGGGGKCRVGGRAEGCGTIFSITAGTEKVLGTFSGETEGEYPTSGLIPINGALYGTTSEGGTDAQGTVFRITTAGVKRVLHNFGAGSDGRNPNAALLYLKGTLYGTTSNGGDLTARKGTVFSMRLGGRERVLYDFKGTPDGANPNSALIAVGGVLYGTTPNAGTTSNSMGTVYSISVNGNENVVHSFNSSAEGGYPNGLIDVNGTLYGTTDLGGNGDFGTVYSLSP
ncbi:MAG TPA: choice-of-anchor tandem repeat GloVer-containing protein [Candidatus Cybelea sp.]|jgi:uncharacterized repeat protein (TIGR03803 family)|nr:choice-of-anchor tandem repeat GloVer-containing protein [Candidatus Cybelea sp.]